MQVSNNNVSPNFGMALKIKCTPDELAKAGSNVLEKLGKAGEELADTKYWDLEVLNGMTELRYRVNGRHCANAYLGEISGKAEPHNEFLTIKSTWDGTDGVCGRHQGDACETIMQLANKEAAVKAYESLNGTYGLDNAVNATKVLEDWTTFQTAKNDAIRAAEEEAQAKAVDLFKKYGSVEI